VLVPVARGGAADVDAAVQAAQAALEGEWGGLSAAERGRVLMRVSDGVLEQADELARLEALDVGKPLKQGRADAVAPFAIRVVALNPVAGDTPMLKTFMGGDTPEVRAKFLSTIPIGRFSTPEDLGNAACFLCSDEASMITGVAMEVDGGRCI
jgi:acyl-CoA reductase-like NAD-dependent aldehyde dehydrogenase